MPSFPIVDTHVHLYDPGLLNYPWMADHPRLLAPHLMPDFDRARGVVEVDRVVIVEVDVDPVGLTRWRSGLLRTLLIGVGSRASVVDPLSCDGVRRGHTRGPFHRLTNSSGRQWRNACTY